MNIKFTRIDAPVTEDERRDFKKYARAAGRSMRRQLRFLIQQFISQSKTKK